MAKGPRVPMGRSLLMETVRQIAARDGRGLRDAVKGTGLAKSTWAVWLQEGAQPRMFQQLEQVLDNYGYALLPVPKGTAQAEVLAALARSLVGAPASAPVAPVEQRSDE